MRKIAIIIIILIISALGVGYYFIKTTDINSPIKTMLESKGKKLLGKDVSVKSVDMDITKGKGKLKQIQVANLLSIKSIDIDFDISSVASNPKIVNSVKVDGVSGTIVMKQDGSFNIDHIQKKLQQRLAKEKTKVEKEVGKKASKKNYDPNIAIKEIIITNIKMKLDLSVLNGKSYDITMDILDAYNVGGKKGLPASQVGGIVMNTLLNEMLKTINARLNKIAEDKIKDALKKEAGKLLEDLFN